MRVELSLPDEVYLRAQRLAQVSHRGISDVLIDTLALSLPTIEQSDTSAPLSELSDVEVLALTQLQLKPKEDQRLSVLLDQQQAGELADSERSELWTLMQQYQAGLLRKAQALQEAVRRGLREPLTP